MEPSKYKGKAITISCGPNTDDLDGKEMLVEDYWINIRQRSWMNCRENPACMKYEIRAAAAGLPRDDKVLYGKVDGYGHLIHESEVSR